MILIFSLNIKHAIKLITISPKKKIVNPSNVLKTTKAPTSCKNVSRRTRNRNYWFLYISSISPISSISTVVPQSNKITITACLQFRRPKALSTNIFCLDIVYISQALFGYDKSQFSSLGVSPLFSRTPACVLSFLLIFLHYAVYTTKIGIKLLKRHSRTSVCCRNFDALVLFVSKVLSVQF